MHSFEIVLLLLGGTTVLAVIAQRLGLPVPILMVIGGLGVALLPQVHAVTVPPDLAFAIFVPPLLFRAALTTSPRGLRTKLRSILLLAVGLVIASAFAVGWAAHATMPGVGWASAFVLGAILSPPDAIIGISLARANGVPRRVLSLVEGETLLNDATAFVLYRQAVHAVTSGTFSFALAVPRFLFVAAGGAAVGYVANRVVDAVRRRVADPVLSNVAWLLAPFIAFLPAEALGVSGVLSVVVAGLLLRRSSSTHVTAHKRIRANAIYDVVEFLLNSLTFILIGMQVGAILRDAHTPPLGEVARCTAIITATLIAIRVVWIYPSAYLPWFLRGRARHEPRPSFGAVSVLAWMGMRGGDSLVTALALPLVTLAGAPLPGRDLIVAVTFGVILTTLILQGLTIGPLIRRLNLPTDASVAEEEGLARRAMHAAAGARLEEIVAGHEAPEDILAHATRKQQQAATLLAGTERRDAHVHLERALLAARRETAIKLRDDGTIDDGVLRHLERELDLEEMRLDAGLGGE